MFTVDIRNVMVNISKIDLMSPGDLTRCMVIIISKVSCNRCLQMPYTHGLHCVAHELHVVHDSLIGDSPSRIISMEYEEIGMTFKQISATTTPPYRNSSCHKHM